MLAWLMTKAFLVGLVGACTAGPVFFLVMHRAMSRGMLYGFVSALGTAVVEGAYFALALAGVLGFSWRNPLYLQIFELASGIVLMASGVAMFIGYATSPEQPVAADGGGLLWMAISAGFLTASNPFSLLYYLGIAAKLFSDSISTATSIARVLCGAIAIASGSLLTLTLVSVIASRLGSFLSTRFERIMSLVTASVLCCAAIYLLGHVGYSFLAAGSSQIGGM